MIEIEMLGVVWAVLKCRIYLQGLNSFTVVCDHKPLLSILNNQTLDEIQNPRLQRLKQKLAGFNLTMEWKSGKSHMIPDSLSRAPVNDPEQQDMLAEEEDATDHTRRSVFLLLKEDQNFQDPLIEKISEIARTDEDYRALKNQIEIGFPPYKNSLRQELQPFWPVRSHLTIDGDLVLKGCQLFIPRAARKSVLAQLHASHQGIEKTKRRARQTVYWPGISNDIKNIVEACESCQQNRPSLQKEPMILDPLPNRPFSEVSMDLFSTGGKYFMVYVDRLSGWPIVCRFGSRCPDSKTIVTTLSKIFADTGVPVRVRCDNGPQFAKALDFRQFLKRWNVILAPSSPHFPQSNGHAEAGVKAMKTLILKCLKNGSLDEEAYAAGLLEFRNTPTAAGMSPSQVLFGHPLRSLVPAHHKSFAKEWQRAADVVDREVARQRTAERYNVNSKELKPLKLGTWVRMQNPTTKKWDMSGVVIGIGPYRKYSIRTTSGRVFERNRRHLKRTQEGAGME